MRRVAKAGIAGGGAAAVYLLVARGSLTLDVGIGRSEQPLGPVTVHVAASPDVVFDVVASPYLGRTPRALAGKLDVWERGSDMVLAAHHTRVRGFVATTLETVRFERPARIDFRLVRGPVPHVAESFRFAATDAGTALTWEGTLGTDFWGVGRAWGRRVAKVWDATVRDSLAAIAQEAERRQPA